MFEIDLNAADEGEWFFYQESHFDTDTDQWVFDPPVSDARVRVRLPDDFFRQRISKRKRITEHVHNPKQQRMERISYMEEQSFQEAQKEVEDGQDYMITGLENFKDKRTGDMLECTREVKIALMRIPQFDRFLGRCLRILRGAEAERKEDEEKN